MSLRVNTNVNAMNALRNVGATNTEYSKSLNKLSTGLRINSAADDPAGLIASESLRAQIGGIEQAVKNNQDAVNYAKTAEGALDEVNKLLRDARSLAVASANSGTLTASQIQANQTQLDSIVASITRISSSTNFGGKKLLDGSAGVMGAVTDGTKFGAISLSGSFGGSAITANAAVTVQVTQAAAQAIYTGSKTFTATETAAAGSFTINGTTFTSTTSDTASSLVDKVNAAQGSTGVRATWTATEGIQFTSIKYGSGARIDLSDANGVVLSSAGYQSAAGTDVLASVAVGSTVGVLFTGGRMGNEAFTLTDTAGNRISMLEAGNSVSTMTAGQAIVGSAQFQIGGGAGETATMSLGNFAASQLGTGIVSGKNLSNVDLTSATNATDALKVIDQAINDVARARGDIGSFQRNILESQIRSLGAAKENLSATESTIRDTDVAEEMTNFTKLQILQQAGMAMLSQANSAPQSVLSLLQ